MSYKYKEQGDNKKDPKSFRNEEGKVKTAPTNFYTNAMKKGKVGKNVTFNNFEFVDGDKFDIAKTLARKEREYHMTKI
jgi:hypothetical protein